MTDAEKKRTNLHEDVISGVPREVSYRARTRWKEMMAGVEVDGSAREREEEGKEGERPGTMGGGDG